MVNLAQCRLVEESFSHKVAGLVKVWLAKEGCESVQGCTTLYGRGLSSRSSLTEVGLIFG